jgi:pimeloyl-ACP methyl ester carboxylesterase
MILFNLPRYNSPEEAHRLFWLGSPNYRKLLGQDSVTENLAQLRRAGVDLFLRYAWRFPFAVYADCRKFTLRSLTSTLWHSLLTYSVDGALDQLPSIPTLLVHGQRDQVAPVENVRPLPGRYAFMSLREIEDSGHHVFLTHSRFCVRLIAAFAGEGSGVPMGRETEGASLRP